MRTLLLTTYYLLLARRGSLGLDEDLTRVEAHSRLLPCHAPLLHVRLRRVTHGVSVNGGGAGGAGGGSSRRVG